MKKVFVLSLIALAMAFGACNGEGSKKEAEVKTIIAQPDMWTFSTSGLTWFGFTEEDGTSHSFASQDSKTPGLKEVADAFPPNEAPPANYNKWFEVKYQEQEYEYIDGSNGETLTDKALFVVSVKPIKKK